MALGRYGKWSYDMVGGMYRVFCGEGMQTREYSTMGEAKQLCQEMHIRDLEIENNELKKQSLIGIVRQAGQAFYTYFSLTPTRINTRDALKREFKEFDDELKRTHIDKKDLQDEFGDAFYTLVMAGSIHLSDTEMADAVLAVIAKNKAKNHDTHVVDNGTVLRRNKKQVS